MSRTYISSLLLLGCLLCIQGVKAQYGFKAIVKDSRTNQPLQGVSVLAANGLHGITAATGLIHFQNINTDTLTFSFSYTGYQSHQALVDLADTTLHIVLLTQQAAALDEVTVVSSIRNNDRIENATTKVEVLGLAEMNEESTLKPGNIASILGDMSGVQIQQSSAVSGNANIRIQGLSGKYTQILRDGMPLFEGYSGGFGLLSIPPLDLKQVELIKGPASTLYGGGAIGGLVNLISKKPSYKPDASFLINQTTLKETNINAYYAQRNKHIGLTFFAGQNFQKQVDVNNDGFSDVPNWKNTVIHPTLFIYPSASSYISVGWSGSFEERLGGDMLAIKGKEDASHPYYENNKLNRNTFLIIAENHFSNTITGTFKSSLSTFYRGLSTNTYVFNARQNNYYAEASLLARTGRHSIIGGVNITGDEFNPSSKTPAPVGAFSNLVMGIFAQDTWQLLSTTKLEGGLRFDHHTTYGNFILPRIAMFQRFSKEWGARLGFGMGYKTPNPLEPQIKDYDIYNIQPLSAGIKAEKSYGGNIEVNYKKDFNEDANLFINHAFFITAISDPVIANEDVNGKVSFIDEPKSIITRGFDTYVQANVHSFELYVGYTYTDAIRKYMPQNQFMPITPRHRAASVISYEAGSNWTFGIEASYTGYQYREDASKTPGYLFAAAMIKRQIGPKITLVANCENLLDERQSKYESLYTGNITSPTFKTLWAPIDGRVLNLSLRWQPFAE